MDGCLFATVPEFSLCAFKKDIVCRVYWNTVSVPGFLAHGAMNPDTRAVLIGLIAISVTFAVVIGLYYAR
jgi:hypothetical protein